MMTNFDTTPVYCVPDAIPAGDRAAHFKRARRLMIEMAEERQELKSGYAFRFRADALETIAQFIVNERKCCPFLDFEVTIAAASGPVWLRMTGPDGAREALKAELGVAKTCSCC